ncbi:MFS transporter [Rickettsiella grylli]|uniref:Lysosomal dipeptide transporter MFSD1 n=1 Tax=Rickettsiella grylli TaxID=59196 RepID=A8PQ44_9COXI|nr:MFS transporter [Rickettsiella grylli]EDP45649.1 major facilitator family transporter [Rickettsiella grylli]EDP46978.1 major facilitator family transporter [Rickettsiella grylli]
MVITPSKRMNDRSFCTLEPWLVCLSAALFFFYEFIQLGMFNSISQELMRDFSINASQLGFLSATYFYADVIFLLFAGVLVDRFSIRRIILTAMVMVVLSTILFAFSASFKVAALSHFIAGIGNAFCFLSCIKLATRWFSSQRLALIIGIIITIAMSGGIVAQTPFALVVHALGWRNAVLINAGLGLLITLLIYLFVRDYPMTYPSQKIIESAIKPIPVMESMRLSLQNKQNILAGLYTCLLNLPIILLGALWGTLYLTQVHHLEKTQASLVSTMIFLGTIIGSPFVGWFSDFIARRRLLMIIGALFSLLILTAILLISTLHFYTLLVLFLLLGFFTSTQIISYPLIAESNPRHLTGLATSLASILIMGGGAVFQPLFGWLIDLNWNQTILHGVPYYSRSNFLYGMSIIPLGFSVSLIVAFCLRETYCQPFIHEKNLC